MISGPEERAAPLRLMFEAGKTTMKTAGYSGTPLHKKLGIKPGQTAWMRGEPVGYGAELRKAGNFEIARSLSADLDFIHVFTASRTELQRDFSKLRDALRAQGMLWVSWPKKSSGKATDLDENIVRELGLKSGLVDVKVCAVDETWSALKFVFRLKDRTVR